MPFSHRKVQEFAEQLTSFQDKIEQHQYLTRDEIDKAKPIIESYYVYLQSEGILYGKAASDVVHNHALFGATANKVLVEAFEEKHPAWREAELDTAKGTIMVALALADITLRSDTENSNEQGFVEYRKIANYHYDTFDDYQLPPSAWGGSLFEEFGGSGSWMTFYDRNIPLDKERMLSAVTYGEVSANGVSANDASGRLIDAGWELTGQDNVAPGGTPSLFFPSYDSLLGQESKDDIRGGTGLDPIAGNQTLIRSTVEEFGMFSREQQEQFIFELNNSGLAYDSATVNSLLQSKLLNEQSGALPPPPEPRQEGLERIIAREYADLPGWSREYILAQLQEAEQDEGRKLSLAEVRDYGNFLEDKYTSYREEVQETFSRYPFVTERDRVELWKQIEQGGYIEPASVEAQGVEYAKSALWQDPDLSYNQRYELAARFDDIGTDYARIEETLRQEKGGEDLRWDPGRVEAAQQILYQQEQERAWESQHQETLRAAERELAEAQAAFRGEREEIARQEPGQHDAARMEEGRYWRDREGGEREEGREERTSWLDWLTNRTESSGYGRAMAGDSRGYDGPGAGYEGGGGDGGGAGGGDGGGAGGGE